MFERAAKVLTAHWYESFVGSCKEEPQQIALRSVSKNVFNVSPVVLCCGVNVFKSTVLATQREENKKICPYENESWRSRTHDSGNYKHS